MLYGAICGAVRARQRLGSECGPSSVHPRPGKASGGWGETDAPQLSRKCSLWASKMLAIYGHRGGGKGVWRWGAKQGCQRSVQPRSIWASGWGCHERKERRDSAGTQAVHPKLSVRVRLLGVPDLRCAFAQLAGNSWAQATMFCSAARQHAFGGACVLGWEALK